MTNLTARGTPRVRNYTRDRARPGESLLDRLSRHITEDPATGCWIWRLVPDDKGYGRLTIDGKSGYYAHRVSYEVHVGPIPDGLHLDHLCRTPACVNPDHLEPVTPQVNTLRGIGFSSRNARKTHCPQNHPYDDENTYIDPDGLRRACRTCRRQFLCEWLARNDVNPLAAIARRWARAQGIPVARRGKLPQRVWDAYLEAHDEAAA